MSKILKIFIPIVSFLFFIGVAKAETPTLEQIANSFNESKAVKTFADNGVTFEASAGNDKIVVTSSANSSSDQLEFSLEGNVLSGEFKDDQAFTGALISTYLIDSIEKLQGYDEGEFLLALTSDAIENYTLENEGLKFYSLDDEFDVFIDISKKIPYPDLSNEYITTEDFEVYQDMIDSGSITATKGYLSFSKITSGDNIVFTIAQKDELTEMAYKSILSFIEVLFNSNKEVEYFKQFYPAIYNTTKTFDGFKIEFNPTKTEYEKSIIPSEKYYDFLRITINKDEVEKAIKNMQFGLLRYSTHIENIGWQSSKYDGVLSGTEGQSLRLEGIKIELNNPKYSGNIEYKTHIQNIGWERTWKQNGEMSGTEGKALRLEAIQIRLTDSMATYYDVYYRVHVQNLGWLGWAKNGEEAGTAGYGLRLEAIEIKLVKKGEKVGNGEEAFIESKVSYTTHVENIGWQDVTNESYVAGTEGQSLRLEAIKINLQNQKYIGNIEYKTHIQNIGWENSWYKNGEMSGTSGQSLRLEAIQIRLTGTMATYYDVYYRVHAENFGWLGWAKNGEEAGTAGYGYRLEAIQIMLVEKGTGIITGNSFKENE